MEIFTFTGYLRDGIEEKLMFSEQIKLLKENTDVRKVLIDIKASLKDKEQVEK